MGTRREGDSPEETLSEKARCDRTAQTFTEGKAWKSVRPPAASGDLPHHEGDIEMKAKEGPSTTLRVARGVTSEVSAEA